MASSPRTVRTSPSAAARSASPARVSSSTNVPWPRWPACPRLRGDAVIHTALLEGDQVLQRERPQDLIDHNGVGDLGLMLGLETALGVGRGLLFGTAVSAPRQACSSRSWHRRP